MVTVSVDKTAFFLTDDANNFLYNFYGQPNIKENLNVLSFSFPFPLPFIFLPF